MSLKAGTGHREAPRLPHAIKQRARPRLLLVDDALRIVQYEAAALTLLEEMCGGGEPARLPAQVEAAVTKAVRDIDEQHHHATVMPVPALIVHISRVHGSDTSFFALMLERASRRAPVASAVRRYCLTNREREVLELVMRGLHAPDIATELSISPTTVTGYFKGLLRKTESKSRAEMIAKVLGWDEGDAHAQHS